MEVKQQIKTAITNALKELGLPAGRQGIEGIEPYIEHPKLSSHGDYSSNIAMAIFGNKELGIRNKGFKSPLELGQKIASIFNSQVSTLNFLDRAEAITPGFINFWLSEQQLIDTLRNVLTEKDGYGKSDSLKGERIMVEYAHPNTHKEMHIGHMRTLITGEALARIFSYGRAHVFRANYQGDIGPHVAKAIFGVQKLLSDRGVTLEDISKKSNREKARFLGEAYVIGNKEYDAHKSKIDGLNAKLYSKVADIEEIYKTTRQWSLDYFDDLYKKFDTTFDRLFFESEVSDCGKAIVLKNVGKVFEESEGAVIFPGKKYGLHNRVFVTAAGYPTYEGKDICLGFEQYKAFPFDRNIHVVASEQTGYFRVVLKALELLDPEKFKGKEHHLSMGMVHLVGRKMSSRTGEVLTVDWLVDTVKSSVAKLMEEGRIKTQEREAVTHAIAIGAIKYSVLRVGTGQDVAFDIDKSVSLDGDSGPYVQYTFARTQSVLAKIKVQSSKIKTINQNVNILENEELQLLRLLTKFPEVVQEAAKSFSPSLLCIYLFDLSQAFNLFYQKHPILESANSGFRVALTAAVGQTIKNSLNLLGIKAPERM
ncbi:MAG: arginine--tRNA ligase [Candidatus Levybacteria bacterium]|nr:arginine--tRNA ligase [Candidatus Levybacteria bacterium]